MTAITPIPRSWRAGSKTGRPRSRDDWRTPPELYEALNVEFGFELDAACTVANQLAPRGLCLDADLDAMVEPWAGGPIWCNPPYSDIRPWLARGRQAAAAGEVVVMLIPADTSTRWWADHVASTADEVRFVRGRLRFLRPDGSDHRTARNGGGMTGPSAIVIYRPGGGPPAYSYVDRQGRPVADREGGA